MSDQIGKAKQTKPTFTESVKERLEKAANRIQEVTSRVAERNDYIFGSSRPERLKRDDLSGHETNQIEQLLSDLETNIGILEDAAGLYLNEL